VEKLGKVGSGLNDTIIKMQDVEKIYPTKKGPLVAVQDVNFAINKEDFVSLVGPSGCGKSTIIRILGGILDQTRGTVTYFDREFSSGVKGDILSKIGFVFQSHNLLPWLSIKKNLSLPLEIFKLSGAKWEKRIDELLEMVGLTAYKNAYPAELSSGMQQRIGVIRALVHDPEILLMDEPFGSLDDHTRREMGELLMEIWARRQMTILFVTHSIDEALMLGDRIILFKGRPGKPESEIHIELPRPRDHLSAEFTALHVELRKLLADKSR